MEQKKIKLLMERFVTHDVRSYIFEKPSNFKFNPGQATELAIDKEGFKEQWRPFTFTSKNEDLILEFTIKIYPKHDKVTKRFCELRPGDEVRMKEVFGTIKYKGKGVFIAGGTGITPFIAILRNLRDEGKLEKNKLIFSNKTKRDIILEKEFKEMFPEKDLILTLTNEDKKEKGYEYKKINKEFLEKHIRDFRQNFYICGPPGFTKDIIKILEEKGVNQDFIVFEGKN